MLKHEYADELFKVGDRVLFEPPFPEDGRFGSKLLDFVIVHPEYEKEFKKKRGKLRTEGFVVVTVRRICNCGGRPWSGYVLHDEGCQYARCIYHPQLLKLKAFDGKIIDEEIAGHRLVSYSKGI